MSETTIDEANARLIEKRRELDRDPEIEAALHAVLRRLRRPTGGVQEEAPRRAASPDIGQWLNASGVPPCLCDASWQSWDERINPRPEGIPKVPADWAGGFLVFAGEVGRGKSLAAAALLHEIAMETHQDFEDRRKSTWGLTAHPLSGFPRKVRWLNCRLVVDELERAAAFKSSRVEGERLRYARMREAVTKSVAESEILIMDGYGAHHPTMGNPPDEWIEIRYEAGLRTLVTMDSLIYLKERGREASRLASRKVVHFSGTKDARTVGE